VGTAHLGIVVAVLNSRKDRERRTDV